MDRKKKQQKRWAEKKIIHQQKKRLFKKIKKKNVKKENAPHLAFFNVPYSQFPPLKFPIFLDNFPLPQQKW